MLWYVILMLSSPHATTSEALSGKYQQSVERILDYFHPNYAGKIDCREENYNDPCTLNETLLSEEAERSERVLCTKLYRPCSKADAENPYRKIDGHCNNLKHPDWGAAGTCHQRFLPHDYSDGVSHPKKSCLKVDLPNVRELSNALHKETKLKTHKFTLHFMEWGQVIAHDSSFLPIPMFPERGPGSCCFPKARVDDECIAADVPDDDDFYPGKRNCLSFQRVIKCPLCTKGVRQSLNRNTGFLDLSIVYGNDENTAKSLRSWKDGMLRTQNFPGIGALHPPVEKRQLCNSNPFNVTEKCFLAGDDRVNQNVLLLTYQLMLLRNHNFICKRLKKINRKWKDDRLYEEARKINIAQAQMITFGWYLKHVFGPDVTRDFGLDVLPGRTFTQYDPTLNPSVFAEFSAAAQRYGHTMIPNSFLEKEHHHGSKKKFIRVENYFYHPFDFYSGQFDRLALGMAGASPRFHDLMLSSSVRNFLYDKRNETLFRGSDLAATTIVRLRDLGVPSYTYYLKYFFNYEVRSFCDLKKFIPADIVKRFRKIYRSVHDVNLYSSLLSEYHIRGGFIGPTLAAILLVQYNHTKFGDRYYFEHGNQAGSFTPEQLEEIKTKTSLARIICDTTKISKIQRDPFLLPSRRNKQVPCASLPALDLSHWKEEKKNKKRRNKNIWMAQNV